MGPNGIDEKLIDTLYEHFKKVNVPSVLSFDQMDEFAPLYNKSNLSSAIDGTMKLADEQRIKELSQKLYSMIDPFKPILVVPKWAADRFENEELNINDIEKMCDNHDDGSYRLPAIFMRLAATKEANMYVDALGRLPEDHISPTAAPRRTEYTAGLCEALSRAQNIEDILHQAQTTDAIIREFDKYNNKNIEQQNESAESGSSSSGTSTLSSVDDDFEFQFDE